MSLEDLLWVGMYNVFEANIKHLYFYLKTYRFKDEYDTVGYLDLLPTDCNHYIRIVWSYMVLEYGDYGTSPRFGWINQPLDEILKEFEEVFETKEFEEVFETGEML